MSKIIYLHVTHTNTDTPHQVMVTHTVLKLFENFSQANDAFKRFPCSEVFSYYFFLQI